MPGVTAKYAYPYPLGTDLVADGDNAIKALADRIEAINNAAWIALPFGAGWTNFGTGYQVCEYRKVGDMVELRGVANGPAATSTIATLPAGYRPAANHIFVSDSAVHARIDVIAATGVLSAVLKPAAGYISLSTIRFQV